MIIASLDCPHCKKNLVSRNTGWVYQIDAPLKNCPYCGGEYLMPYTYEWSIAGPFYQIFYCFFADYRCAGAVFPCIELASKEWLSALILFLIWIIFCILRLKFSDSDKIKESYRRTKNNPEYIQKLSDMGYMIIDMRIDPFYK